MLDVLTGVFAGNRSKDQTFQQRVTGQAIGPVQPAACAFSTGIESREIRPGLQIRLDQEDGSKGEVDVRRLRKMIPELVEASLGLRVWAGLVQAVERRLGENLPIQTSLPMPINWDHG